MRLVLQLKHCWRLQYSSDCSPSRIHRHQGQMRRWRTQAGFGWQAVKLVARLLLLVLEQQPVQELVQQAEVPEPVQQVPERRVQSTVQLWK